MSKVRVYLLARELGINNADLIKTLNDLGVEVTSHMSSIDKEIAAMVKEMLAPTEADKGKEAPVKKEVAATPAEEEKNIKSERKAPKTAKQETRSASIKVEGPLTIKNIAAAAGQNPNAIMQKLINDGVMIALTQAIDEKAKGQIESSLGFKIEAAGGEPLAEKIKHPKVTKASKNLKKRPPVVTIMGHVDHGKTKLLDTIRETNVISTEAGGITQHIGAYQVRVDNSKITFLDTPGHEAFTAMRARGAQVTDLAILVVAADDGVMPQTIEAINHAKDAKIPIIVAVNKIDKPTANAERVKQQLSEHNLVPEEWGGDTVFVEVSALHNQNIDELLEMIILITDMEELVADPTGYAEGIIIESKLDKGRGAVATVLVNSGTLHVGDVIIAGLSCGRVRAMFTDAGKRVTKAGPSTPVEVLGFSAVPTAGDKLRVLKDEKEARALVAQRQEEKRAGELHVQRAVNLEQFYQQIQEGQIKDLKIIIKGDVDGTVGALKDSLMRIESDEVNLEIIHSGVGAITESDVILAAASNAIIIGFNVRPDNNAQRAAEKEKVDIRTYRIIYQIIDDVKKALEGLLEPEIKERVIGQAEVRQTFKVPKIGIVAGLYVNTGRITRNSLVRLIRDGVVIHEGKIDSLRRFQDDVREVEENYECGLGIEGFHDIKEGDTIEAYVLDVIKRQLN